MPDAKELTEAGGQQFANFPGHLFFPQTSSGCSLAPPVTVTSVSRPVCLQSDHTSVLSGVRDISMRGQSKGSLPSGAHSFFTPHFLPRKSPKSMFFNYVSNDHVCKTRTKAYKVMAHGTNTIPQPLRTQSLIVYIQC